jgi:hypothetical protein
MHKRHALLYIWISMWFVVSLGCSSQGKSITSKPPSPTVDLTLLSNYILGGWSSVDVKSNTSNPIGGQYRILFQSSSIVKYTVIYPAGDSEGFTSTYSFLNENSIYVENLRTGGETWLLEVKDDKLIVTRNFGSQSMTLMMERVE